MINITEKQKCCGCGACAGVCPKDCIEMKEDVEGFFYPFVNKNKCVDCGACERVCPIINCRPDIPFEQTAYIVQNKDECVRRESTSGGAFTAIAEYVIEQGGVVFGAAYDDTFRVHHMYVEEKTELWRFRNSKYVQSDTEETFSQAEAFLKKGRMVCYSGTPCQIEGLKRFLGKLYEKLVLVDVVCHGIPSPLVWKKYLEYQKVNDNKPDNIYFRDKFYGYKYSTMSLIKNGKTIYHAGSQFDPMLRAFFTDICDRPSCYACPFKKRYRVSDITVWDCFSVYDFDKIMDDDKGTTRVLCHTAKGEEIMRELRNFVRYKEVDPDKLVSGVKEMYESASLNPRRKQFFKDMGELSGKELFEKYYPITVKIKLKTVMRKVLLKTGAYKTAKKCLNKLRGR